MKFSTGLLVLLVPSVAESRRLKGKFGGKDGEFTAPHEVHQYEQTKFYDESEWACEFADIRGTVGCLKCRNPRPVGGEALIVEVKAMYKREDLNVKDETTNKPRKHCIFPGRGEFWTCFNTNLVIEPDTSWLGALKDKPIYDEHGVKDVGGEQCYPGNMIVDL